MAKRFMAFCGRQNGMKRIPTNLPTYSHIYCTYIYIPKHIRMCMFVLLAELAAADFSQHSPFALFVVVVVAVATF